MTAATLVSPAAYSVETTPNTPLEWALYYRAVGLSIIPLRPRTKEAFLDDWQKEDRLLPLQDELRRWFSHRTNYYYNIGVVCGRVSGNLVVADFDSADIFYKFWDRKLAEAMPNETFTVRTSRGYQVWAFDSQANFSKIDFRPTLELELRFNNHYVAAPPSIHPSGAIYTLLGAYEIKRKDGFASTVIERARSLGWKGNVTATPLGTVIRRTTTPIPKVLGANSSSMPEPPPTTSSRRASSGWFAGSSTVCSWR